MSEKIKGRSKAIYLQTKICKSIFSKGIKRIFLKNKKVIIISISHNFLLDNLKFNLTTKGLLDKNHLFLFEYNKYDYLKDKKKIKKNLMYYILRRLEKSNIEYSFIDTGSKKQKKLFVKNVSWKELSSLYFFSFLNRKDRKLIKNTSPVFYKHILESRENVMMKRIKEKLINSNKNLVIIVGEIHCEELFNKINLLKNDF